MLPVDVETLKSEIYDTFSHDVLKKLYDKFLYVFDDYDPKTDNKKYVHGLSKIYLTRVLTNIFSSKESFDKLMEIMPSYIKETMAKLLWINNKINIDDLKFKSKIVISDDNPYFIKDLLKIIGLPFHLFQISYDRNYDEKSKVKFKYFLSLPPITKIVLKEYFEPPDAFKLKPVEKISDTEFVHEIQDNILRDILLYYKYISNEKYEFTLHKQIPKGILKSMVETCSINEFYYDKDLTYIKTELIYSFLFQISRDIKEKSSNPLELLKQTFTAFSSENSHYHSITPLLHLKGFGEIPLNNIEHRNRNISFNKSVISLLKSLEVNKWYSFKNIRNFSFLKDFKFELINQFSARDLYFNSLYGAGKHVFSDKEFIKTEELYAKAIAEPSLKAILFLFSSFGIIDAAYDFPENSIKIKDKNYLSVFDGLKYIKLTELGAYIVGLTQSYEYKQTEEKTSLLLEEENLIISVSGRNKLKIVFIKNFAEPISDNTYKVTYETFLNGCLSKKDIEKKIDLFKTEISKDPPENWQKFFGELLDKFSPLQLQEDLLIYKIKNNKELVELLLKDDILKKLVQKVENFQIAVNKSDFTKLKKRLEQFGYLIP